MNSDKYPENNEQDVLNQLREIAESVMYAAEGGTIEQVLERIAHVSRSLVHARYAALGVPDGRGGLRYFKVSGITQEQIREIPHLPVGRGMLGVIMRDREVVRLEKISDDPRSCGFPPGHPPMESMLGVPIQVGTQLLGILYLCDREDGQPFDERDQWLVETMAGYAALAIAGAQLTEQQGRLSTLEERQRIGMELHDGVIQSLYAVGMHLDLMRYAGNIRSEDLGEIIGQLNQVIEDIRRYILNLRAARVGTINDCFREMLGRLYIPSTLQVEINAPDEPPPFAETTFAGICQIANEAISNAVRHADATCIVISTLHDQQRFQITITDDGKGFDLEAAQGNSGLGLRNMEQRARLYGGHVTIQSEPGQGTTLTITVPVNTL
jgi:signal transduction histidine kinase